MYLADSALNFRPVALVTSQRGSVFRFMTSMSSPIILISRTEDAGISNSIHTYPSFLGPS
jgi:hypothetical protein